MQKLMPARGMLKRLGLTKHEAEVYLTLVELGPTIISRIAAHTGMHRPTIYQSLRALEMKGLATISPKGKQKRYVAESPDKLRMAFDLFRQSFERTLPDLQQSYDKKKRKPLIKFLEGKRGFAHIFEDVLHTLKRGDVFYRYTSRRASQAIKRYVPRGYYAHRKEKGIQRFMITDALTDWQQKPDMNRAVKFIPEKHGFLNDNITQVIYGDKVAVGDLDTETVFVIESPLFAELQRKIFKALYELL